MTPLSRAHGPGRAAHAQRNMMSHAAISAQKEAEQQAGNQKFTMSCQCDCAPEANEGKLSDRKQEI